MPGDILTLKHLLRAGINVNAADYDRQTAAHIAAAEGNAAAIKVLVDFGADLNAKDRWNHSVLHKAQESSSKSSLFFLSSLNG
jgi:ankyrin repeat protein